jgi:hypothetical protein
MKTTVNARRCNPIPRPRIWILGCFLLQLPLIVVDSPEEGADREPLVAVGDIAISNENPFLNLLIQPIPKKESYAENLETLRVPTMGAGTVDVGDDWPIRLNRDYKNE